jgi:hypothetical protein
MRYILIILVFLSVGANAQMVIKAHANYRPYAQPAVNLLLDDYPNAAAAYSLRKLDKDYTGAAIRVRKDTTGQPEQDIGFTASGDLDTVGLKNFLLTRSGFVTTWYDQSGNARNASQTTQANQPRIANLGVIDRENSRPTVRFDGSNDHYNLGDILDIGQNSFLSLAFSNISNNNSIYAKSAAANTSNRYALIVEAGIAYSFLQTDIARHATATGSGKRLYCSQIIRGTSNTLFFNNSQVGQNNAIDNYNMNSTFPFLIGAYNDVGGGSAGFYFLNGTLSELLIYLSDQSSNRTGLSNNINTYYSIY